VPYFSRVTIYGYFTAFFFFFLFSFLLGIVVLLTLRGHSHTLRWDGMGCAGNSTYFYRGVRTCMGLFLAVLRGAGKKLLV